MSLSQYVGAYAEGWKSEEKHWFGGTIVSISREEGKVTLVLGKTRVLNHGVWGPVLNEQIILNISVQTIPDPDTNGMVVIGIPGEEGTSAVLFKRGSMPLNRDLSDLLFPSN